LKEDDVEAIPSDRRFGAGAYCLIFETAFAAALNRIEGDAP